MGIWRKMFSSLLAAGVAVIAACGGQEAQEPSPGNDAAAGIDTLPKEPIELVIQNQNFAWDEAYFMEHYGNDIVAKFPHIKLKLLMRGSNIEDSVVTGIPLDIIAAPPAGFQTTIAKFDLQYDITPLIKKYKFDLNRLDPAVVGLSKQIAEGGIYDIPTSHSPAAMIYNKDLFDKFGVAYPKDGMTWDETFDLTKKMTRTEDGVSYWGLFASIGHLLNRNQLSLNFMNPVTQKPDLETTPWKNYLDNMIRMYQAQPISQQMAALTPQKNAWEKAQVAMWLPVSGNHVVPALPNYDYASFPVFSDFPGIGPSAYPVQFYITSKSKHKDEAFEVLSYLTSEEFQLKQSKKGFYTILNSDTVKAAFGEQSEEYKGKNMKALFPKVHAPNIVESKFNTQASAAMTTAFYDVVLGKSDINTALRKATETVNKAIEADKAASGQK